MSCVLPTHVVEGCLGALRSQNWVVSMTRFQARLREEQQAEPAGWLERLRARFMMRPQMHTRPLVALAMTVLLLVGGGAYLDFYWQAPVPKEAAVVHDLQTLDNNAQLLDQLESISADDNGDAVQHVGAVVSG